MTITTFAFIDFYDDQHRTFTLEYEVPGPDDFAPAVDLPTTADQIAVINAITHSGLTGLSTAKVRNYGLKLVQDDLGGVNIGTGAIAVQMALKTRSGIGVVGDPDPFGVLQGAEFKIPSVNESVLTFDNTNRNAVSTTGTLWTALRTALEAIGWQPEGHTIITAEDMQTAVLFNGKRSPMRPR